MEPSQFVPFKYLLKADSKKVVADLFVACYAQRFAKPYPAQLIEVTASALKITQPEAEQVPLPLLTVIISLLITRIFVYKTILVVGSHSCFNKARAL